jgi:hypothetical protein
MQVNSSSDNIDGDKILLNIDEVSRSIKALRLATAIALVSSTITLLPSVKKPSVKLMTIMSGVNDGLGDGSVTQAAAKKQCLDEFATWKVAVLKMMADISEEAQPMDLGKDVLDRHDVSMEAIKHKLIRSDYFIGYTAVLPVVAPFLVKEALAENGFKSELYHGYMILENQLVAGLTTEYVKKRLEEDPKANSTEIFEEFLTTVKSKYPNMQLMQLGRSEGWNNATWAWLIPLKQYTLLRKCTAGGRASMNLSIKSWGFPFQRS